VEPTEKLEQSDSEDEGSHTESKSPEPAKLPPRTPSRSSRHASREPTTPARTPTRSTSRSSLSRQSPAKTIVPEGQNETITTLEPIVEEDKLSPKKDDVLSIHKKDTPPATPQKEEATPPSTPTDDIEFTATSQKEATPITDADSLSPKKETPIKSDNIIKNEVIYHFFPTQVRNIFACYLRKLLIIANLANT
jgi:hypothetical protein